MVKAPSDMRATRARWLRRIRDDRKLTQAKLAKKIGVTPNAISRYESGLDDPSVSVMDRMLVALEIWWVDLHVSPDHSPPPRRDVPRPFVDRSHYIAQEIMDEFVHPTKKPAQYPASLRCWNCQGRPGECQCWEKCKVCKHLFPRGRKCPGALH